MFGSIEKKYLNDELKISLRGGMDLTDIENIGFMPSPEVSYKPVDNFEMIVGAIVLEGNEGTTFSQFNDLDQAFLKIKYNF